MITGKHVATLALSAALALAAGAGVARAQEEPTPEAGAEPEPRELDAAKVKASIDKGVAWLKKQQKPDGRFDDGYASMFPLGPTALAALTLLKCEGASDPAAQKALAALTPKELKKTYDAGLVMMAIEARYAPKEEELAKSEMTYAQAVRKAFARSQPPHQVLLKAGVDFLVKTQQKELWGYPEPVLEDHSNAQYALLGLGAAKRLGMDAPRENLQRALDHFLRAQEASGPEIEAFVVPAADHTVKEIEELAGELKKKKVREDGGGTQIREFWRTATREKMFARGFGYTAPPAAGGNGGGTGGRGGRGGGWGGGGRREQANLSMTTAGLACLVTLKWALEGAPGYDSVKVDKAIRDATAYIAKNFELGSDREHDYYILYGLERAGAMTGCPYFGAHDWYVEGGEWILERQSDDGSWGRPGPVARPLGSPETSLPDTCFALLFLRRGSAPVVPPMPKRIVSGSK